jgi:hypothetical protein
MYSIKFNAIDTDGNLVYCYYRNLSEGKQSTAVERTFAYDKFIEKEPKLAEYLEGDIYSLYIEDNYTEQKSLDGSYGPLSDECISYCKELVAKACQGLAYDELLTPPSIDEEIDSFIKEFFDEEDEPAEQKDFLADFFKELEEEK